MLRSSFTAKRVDVDEMRGNGGVRVHTFLTLVDLDEEGAMSVTNDVENVLAVLRTSGDYKPGMRVIYRDTEGQWDEIVTNAQGDFVCFRSLGGTRVREEALARAISLRHLQ